MPVIKLENPITVDGIVIDSLNMRRCKVRDRRAAAKQWKETEDQEIGLIANLCDVLPSTIDELDLSDYMKLQKELASFFGLNTET